MKERTNLDGEQVSFMDRGARLLKENTELKRKIRTAARFFIATFEESLQGAAHSIVNASTNHEGNESKRRIKEAQDMHEYLFEYFGGQQWSNGYDEGYADGFIKGTEAARVTREQLNDLVRGEQ